MKTKHTTGCPKDLQRLLDLVNSVPFGRNNYMLPWDAIIQSAYFQVTGENLPQINAPRENPDGWQPLTVRQSQSYSEAFELAIEMLKEEVKRFPKLYDHLFKLENFPASQNVYDEIRRETKEKHLEISALESYGNFLKVRRDLRTITQECMSYAKTGKFFSGDNLLKHFGITIQEYPVMPTIDSEGNLDYVSEFVKATRGINPKRLKICPICNQIFWAKRIEAPTCSKKCSNNFHQRKVRIKEYEARQELEYKKLEKLRNTLSLENKLILEQTEKLNKIATKINSERMKNGTL